MLTLEQKIDAMEQENLTLLKIHAISNAEYQRRRHMLARERWLPRLMEFMRADNWEDFIDWALLHHEILQDAFYFYPDVPNELKYEFAIKAYMCHGDSIPAVRAAVRKALWYGKPDLPARLKRAKEIIVYRAGEEPISKAKYRISWTTDIKVAIYFLETYVNRHAKYLYKGKIKPEHIIAYRNDRNEHEIMQYMKVYDIRDIT